MIVRPATPADATAIAALHAESWRKTYRGILRDEFLDGPIDANRRALWDARLSPEIAESRPFVALVEVDSVPQAFVCVMLDADPIWGALLDNLHVSSSLQGRGVGRRLMAEAATWIRQHRPESRMHLWVYEQNLRARRFYERLGGVINGRTMHTAPDGSQGEAVRYGWVEIQRLADLREALGA